jgi:colanic acid/amylovoran biosynthesis glycosyltransferase
MIRIGRLGSAPLKPMHIAVLVDRFPALSETFVLNQITGLIDRGHHVEIFARGRREEIHHPDVDKYALLQRTRYWPELPKQKGRRWLRGAGFLAAEARVRPRVAASALNVRRYGRQASSMNLAYAIQSVESSRRFDVIHCHFGENGIVGMALREMGVLEGALVTSFYGYDVSSYLRRAGEDVYSTLWKQGDLFLPVSNAFRQRLTELKCDPARIVVHRMGIDGSRFRFRARSLPADGVTRLVSVSRLVEKKGIEYAIRAVAQLCEAGRRIVYTVVGEGPLKDSLNALIKQLGVGDVVRMVGRKPQPEVIEILEASHVVVVPSVVAADGDIEGTPAVLMEAMAMGLPAVATRHSGIPEVVHDGISGVLVRERDTADLAGAIAQMVDRSDTWASLGQAGSDHIARHHDIETLNDSLVTLYQTVLDRASRSE